MQRLRVMALGCALLALATPAYCLAQAPSTTYYSNLDVGILGLNLRPFRFFQTLDPLGNFATFLDTDSGTVKAPMIGGRIGWVHYDPATFNGVRLEARGFYAREVIDVQQRLPPDAAFALITGGEGSTFGATAFADFERAVTVSGGDFFYKCDRAVSNRAIVAPYAGLSVLNIDQQFNVVAIEPLTLDQMTLNDRVRANYWGASAGIECLTRIFPTTTCILDFRLSAFELRAERQARQIDSISFTDVQVNETMSRFTGAAMLRFELSQQLRWAHLSLFGSAQYLQVPFVEYGQSFNFSADFTRSQLRIEDAFGYTGGISVCVPF